MIDYACYLFLELAFSFNPIVYCLKTMAANKSKLMILNLVLLVKFDGYGSRIDL